MANILEEKIEYLAAPASGEIINLSQVPDQSFAKKNFGDGFALILLEIELI
jgi:phosphotransferase system IIA component